MFLYTDLKEKYLQVPNEVADDKELSLQAFAIYCKMRRNATHWKFNANFMAEKCGISKTTFYKYLRELYEKGYIKRLQGRSNGKFNADVVYIFKDFENFENIESKLNLEFFEDKQVKKLQKNITKILDSNFESSRDDLIICNKNLDSINTIESSEDCDTFTELQDLQNQEFGTLNNIIDSNNTKESIAPAKAKSVFIDLHSLINDINTHLKAKKQNLINEKALKEAEFNAFLQKLDFSEQAAYNDFIAYRSEKKKLKPTTIRAIQAKFLKLKELGENVNECVKISIERGWSGLFAKKQTQGNFKGNFKRNKAKKVAKKQDCISFMDISDAEIKAYAKEHGIYL